MNIQKCKICDRPFIPTADFTEQDKFNDPNACPRCNEEARQNSAPRNNFNLTV